MPRKNSASTTDARLGKGRVRIGAQPIIWSNDDFFDLGGAISLERCLNEMKEAGYAGAELGRKFPAAAGALKTVLQAHGLELISGWHSTYLASRDFKEEKAGFIRHLDLLAEMKCGVVIVAECTGRTYHQPAAALGRGSCDDVLDAAAWEKVFRGLDALGRLAQERGLKLVYHPHMGTVVEGRPEIDRLMDSTRLVSLLADTGHLAFAGLEPLEIFRQYRERIAHVHLKNVRPDVVREAVAKKLSFKQAVQAGVFTVPGDGGIDFAPLFAVLADANYSGWMVVEAEQDPAKAPPLEYAKAARDYIRRATGL